MNEKTECEKLLHEISNLIDGTISPELCGELEAHVKECNNCRIVVNTTRRTIELYHQDDSMLEMPAGSREKLWKRLELDEFVGKDPQK
jgi:hypothetical protein